RRDRTSGKGGIWSSGQLRLLQNWPDAPLVLSRHEGITLMTTKKTIAALWIAPADYDRAVALSDDGMPATYEMWRSKVDKLVRELPADIEVVRVEADPDEVA